MNRINTYIERVKENIKRKNEAMLSDKPSRYKVALIKQLDRGIAHNLAKIANSGKGKVFIYFVMDKQGKSGRINLSNVTRAQADFLIKHVYVPRHKLIHTSLVEVLKCGEFKT